MFEFNGFFGESRFRIWCQKVLPTIYDDSLSYYELLCKVLKVLEEYGEGSTELANAVAQLGADVSELRTAVENAVRELQVGVEAARGYAESADESAQLARDAVANLEQYKGLEKIASVHFGYDSPEWVSFSGGYYCDLINLGYMNGENGSRDAFEFLKRAKFVNFLNNHNYAQEVEQMQALTKIYTHGEYEAERLEELSLDGDFAIAQVYNNDGVEMYVMIISNSIYSLCVTPDSPSNAFNLDFYA